MRGLPVEKAWEVPVTTALVLLFLSLTILSYLFLTVYGSAPARALYVFAPLNRRLGLAPYRKALARLAAGAGRGEGFSFEEFLSIKELLFAAVFIVCLLASGFSVPAAMVVGFLAFFLPDLRLKEKARERRDEMKKAFVPFLDLLVLVLESGMDFAGAVRFLREKLPDGPLSDELAALVVEMQLGTSREEALERFAARLRDNDVSQFATAVADSGRSGAPLAGAMRTLSVSIKSTRILAAEKAAHEAPVKLLLPLVVFIFPVVFIVLFGPIVIRFMIK